MYILLTDETNQQPSKSAKFFIYGGIFFPIDCLRELDEGIAAIRSNAKYNPEDELKFDTNKRPKNVTQEAAKKAKSEVIALCKRIGCKFIAHVILHKIIAKQDPAKQALRAADYVIGRFNLFLHDVDDFGICLVDNLPQHKEFQYFKEKFTRGLVFPNNKTEKLDRIILYGSTCLGASHASSAVDIVLGSFRYCLNEPKNTSAAQQMIRDIISLMWYSKKGKNVNIIDKGLILRPRLKDIRNSDYKQEYLNLIDHLKQLLNA